MEALKIINLASDLPPVTALEAAVGNTPLLPLQRLATHLWPRVQVAVKAEWFNPGGSVKDRPALNILRTAIANGDLPAGRRLLDSTSGNMGIAYATFGAALGIGVTLAAPANIGTERLAMLRALGAELIPTDPLEGADGARREARRLSQAQPERYFYANQYDNPANWQAHYLGTGPEILAQTQGRVTHVVAGLGTSGTLTGVGRCLREINAAVELVAVQPDAAFHGLEGLKHMPSSDRPGIFDPDLPDRTIAVRTEAAYRMVRRLAQEEGLFVGISSGAAAAAALDLAETLTTGLIVVIFPDAGYKYLSHKELWD